MVPHRFVCSAPASGPKGAVCRALRHIIALTQVNRGLTDKALRLSCHAVKASKIEPNKNKGSRFWPGGRWGARFGFLN
jgi:hypothetical protein